MPGCPLTIHAQPAKSYSVDLTSIELIGVNEPASFTIALPAGKRELLRVGVLGECTGTHRYSREGGGGAG